MLAKTLLVAAAALLLSDLPSASATDYLGGWLASPAKQQCVDICTNSKAAPTCPTSDASCLAKTQRPGDYDYLMLEQLYMPQFCRELLIGVDVTVSHQNVNAYPNGITCKSDVVKSELTIHGLWPNYNAGYAACCNVSDTIVNHPYNSASFAKNQAPLLKTMSTKWIDPTQSDSYDTLCEIYNHEFQKHGLCYSASGSDYEKAAVTYFQSTLNVAALLSTATTQINKWATQSTPQIPSLAAVEKLYTKKVQVFCSSSDDNHRLSVIRTCFAKPSVPGSAGPFTQVDCATAAASGALTPCDSTTPISLVGYTAP